MAKRKLLFNKKFLIATHARAAEKNWQMPHTKNVDKSLTLEALLMTFCENINT